MWCASYPEFLSRYTRAELATATKMLEDLLQTERWVYG
jgi:hypothetical protein